VNRDDRLYNFCRQVAWRGLSNEAPLSTPEDGSIPLFKPFAPGVEGSLFGVEDGLGCRHLVGLGVSQSSTLFDPQEPAIDLLE
jgi:hypothetical protein